MQLETQHNSDVFFLAGLYVNRRTNGSFYRRVSPTSFYPMLSGIATQEQATIMMRKLHSPDYFCVSSEGDFEGLRDDCYWCVGVWVCHHCHSLRNTDGKNRVRPFARRQFLVESDCLPRQARDSDEERKGRPKHTRAIVRVFLPRANV